MKQLFERNIIKKIKNYLDSEEVIVLHGARQVGKTSIIRYLEQEISKENKQTFFLDLELRRFLDLCNLGAEEIYNYLAGAGLDLDKKIYLFIDEIQYLKDPSNLLKIFHDHYGGRIKLIVSGSSSFQIKKKFKNSLVGRTVDFEIWPLSFDEFLTFKNKIYNLNVALTSANNEELLPLYKEYTLYGGYPKIVLESNYEKKEVFLQQIIDTYIRRDIRDLSDIRQIDKFNNLINLLASQSGQLLDILEIANTINLNRMTVENYLFILENTYIISRVKPFARNKRTELFKMPKVFFMDSGLANLLIYKKIPEIIAGNIFETAVYGDLVKKFNKVNINFWRTINKQEIDFILSLDNKIIPLEVKINLAALNTSALQNFKKKYQTNNCCALYLIGQARQKTASCNFLHPWELSKLI